MEIVELSTDIRPDSHCRDVWQDVVCKVIHNVQVKNVAAGEFSAHISGRRYGDISCARFWSKPHHIQNGRETYADSGYAGYLLSWQLEGEAHIELPGSNIHLVPGSIAVIDSRRPMLVSFAGEVKRMVAKLPAKVVEESLPGLVSRHALDFTPRGPLADILQCYLSEISSTSNTLQAEDIPLLAEHTCNLLSVLATQAGAGQIDSKTLRQRAVLQHLQRVACDPGITLELAAGQLGMSARLLQKVLHEMDMQFTRVITQERLQSAARKLHPAAALSISDVAYHSGFNDISHFNRLFKKQFGMSPTDYRLSLVS